MARWVNNPELVPGMFYAFIFQDALRFELGSEEDMANLADVVVYYRWRSSEPGQTPVETHEFNGVGLKPLLPSFRQRLLHRVVSAEIHPTESEGMSIRPLLSPLFF